MNKWRRGFMMKCIIPAVTLFTGACVIMAFCCMQKKGSMDNSIETQEKMDNGIRYIINGDEVKQKRFEALMRELIIDERSHFCYETSTGGVSGYRARHRNTGADATYQTEMVDEVSVFKLTLSPGTAILYKDKKAGFEFWYPPNWHIVKLEMDDCIVEVQPADAADPYARLESFRVVIAKEKNNPFSTSPHIWQASIGNGDQARSSMMVAIENTKFVLTLTAREANRQVLEDILYSFILHSFRPPTNPKSNGAIHGKADCHKEDINHLRRYNESLASGDVFDVWLDMLRVWGDAHHVIPILNERPLFEESIRVISGHHGLQRHSESRQFLEAATMASSFSYNPEVLPLSMFQAKIPLTKIAPEDLAKMYSALGHWTFINVGFSPD
ncbi:MAG: hypothetical protein R6W78_03205 [Bacteroidales bacterium]